MVKCNTDTEFLNMFLQTIVLKINLGFYLFADDEYIPSSSENEDEDEDGKYHESSENEQ